MFSGLVNLLFGSSETDNIRKSAEPFDTESNQSVSNSINCQPLSTEVAEEDGWLLVNKDEEVTESSSSSDSEENLNFTSKWEELRLKPKSISLKRHNGVRTSIRHDAMLRSTVNPISSSMEESWFITPPPCFTSTGPVYMKTSPYENLLIEHPSMSVYRSMTYVREVVKKRNATPPPAIKKDEQENIEECPVPLMHVKPRRAKIQRRQNHEINVERVSNLNNLLNQLVDKHHSEKVHDKREYQAFSRSALKRANKAREFGGKGNRRRRSDLQHCRFNSGANNNRKC